jgi:hypothetical protein
MEAVDGRQSEVPSQSVIAAAPDEGSATDASRHCGFLLVRSSAGSRFVGAAHAQAVLTTVELDGPDHLPRRHVKVRRHSCCGVSFENWWKRRFIPLTHQRLGDSP